MLIKNFLLIVFILWISATNLFAQDSPQNIDKSEALTYKILARFPVNVSLKYIYKEDSKITRVFSNGKSKDFNRLLTYHFSLRAPSAVDKQGFQLIEVSVDSLEYSFTSPDTTIYYNSQADDLRPPKLDDYLNRMVPLGLNFDMTYSPYQEVAKIGGEMLIQKRDYLTDKKTAPTDEMNKATWVNGLQDESLMNLFDVVKGFPPSYKVSIDSTWDKEILCELEGSKFIDSVKFSLTDFNIQRFTIKGVSTRIQSVDQLVRLFGLPQLIDYTKAKGTSEYLIKMHPRGSINQIDANYKVTQTYQVANDFIEQNVDCKKTWILDKMLNW